MEAAGAECMTSEPRVAQIRFNRPPTDCLTTWQHSVHAGKNHGLLNQELKLRQKQALSQTTEAGTTIHSFHSSMYSCEMKKNDAKL